MAHKTHDLVVKVGEYNGKPLYKNVGAMMEGDRGPYLLIDKIFNPAGVPAKEGATSVAVYCFEPKPKSAGSNLGFDDKEEIPF